MPDPIFADPRLAAIYDAFDGERDDLEVYAAMVEEFGARRVLDIGCGTGSFACLLAGRGFEVVGMDPALASLEVARSKPFADRVRWIHGTAADVPEIDVDFAVMTGNVAQVFVDDSEWRGTLRAAHRALRPGGHLVFEVRDPARRAWESWTPEKTRRKRSVPGAGVVEAWTEVTEVALPLVSFRHTYRFESDGATLTSDSTLRFRERDEIEADLAATGFAALDVRDAPDRPGLEFVFIASR
ncbi:MAG: class I SAM-dependent methyltransferase [Dehalococcoidia bacterium]